MRDSTHNPPEAAALDAIAQLLEPLAALALSRGVKLQELEALLRRKLVAQAAKSMTKVAAMSVATGIHRLEVTRLMSTEANNADQFDHKLAASPAAQVFAIWANDFNWQDGKQKPRELIRALKKADSGFAQSFDGLCRSVNKEYPPKTILNELIRLGLAQESKNEAGQKSVRLLTQTFGPSDDQQEMLGYLAANAGDHLRAAVSNVVSQGSHLEQAIYAQPIALTEVQAVRAILETQWQSIKEAVIPILAAAEKAQQNSTPTVASQRVRLGVYMFHEPSNEKATNLKESIK